MVELQFPPPGGRKELIMALVVALIVLVPSITSWLLANWWSSGKRNLELLEKLKVAFRGQTATILSPSVNPHGRFASVRPGHLRPDLMLEVAPETFAEWARAVLWPELVGEPSPEGREGYGARNERGEVVSPSPALGPTPGLRTSQAGRLLSLDLEKGAEYNIYLAPAGILTGTVVPGWDWLRQEAEAGIPLVGAGAGRASLVDWFCRR